MLYWEHCVFRVYDILISRGVVMTIRQRVLLVVTLGPLLTALVCYFVDMRFITESYDAAVL